MNVRSGRGWPRIIGAVVWAGAQKETLTMKTLTEVRDSLREQVRSLSRLLTPTQAEALFDTVTLRLLVLEADLSEVA